jgi:hypothetical protein
MFFGDICHTYWISATGKWCIHIVIEEKGDIQKILDLLDTPCVARIKPV